CDSLRRFLVGRYNSRRAAELMKKAALRSSGSPEGVIAQDDRAHRQAHYQSDRLGRGLPTREPRAEEGYPSDERAKRSERGVCRFRKNLVAAAMDRHRASRVG